MTRFQVVWWWSDGRREEARAQLSAAASAALLGRRARSTGLSCASRATASGGVTCRPARSRRSSSSRLRSRRARRGGGSRSCTRTVAILLRDGQPFVIRGAGGDGSLEALARAGANSVRTWGFGPETRALLDRAHALGLAVTVGIRLGHARHGFDYHDATAVAAQLARVRGEVRGAGRSPVLLMWGVGNEMEGFECGDDPAVWIAVNDVAAMIETLAIRCSKSI